MTLFLLLLFQQLEKFFPRHAVSSTFLECFYNGFGIRGTPKKTSISIACFSNWIYLKGIFVTFHYFAAKTPIFHVDFLNASRWLLLIYE